MAKTKRKASKGKAKSTTKAKPKAKAKAKAKKTAKPKKSARPKAARAAAKRPARTAKKAAKPAKRSAKPKAAKAAKPARPRADLKTDTDLRTDGSLAPVAEDSSGIPARSTTTLLQTVDLNVPPDEVYRAYMLGPRHAEFTGGPAEIDGRVGGRMTAWDGYIMGEFIEIEEGRRIVQSWRTTEWPDGYADSKLELTFTPTETGTRVTMVHSNVPAEQARRYDDGWKEHYWEPLKKYLSWEQPTS